MSLFGTKLLRKESRAYVHVIIFCGQISKLLYKIELTGNMSVESMKKDVSSLKFKMDHVEKVQDNMVQYVKDNNNKMIEKVNVALKKVLKRLEECERENRQLRDELRVQKGRVRSLYQEIDMMRGGGPRFMIIEEE